MPQNIKIIFFGTSDFATPILEQLNNNFSVLAVVTTPDKPVGRGGRLTSSPVKVLAQRLGLTIWQPESLRGNDAMVQKIKALQPDLLVVAAYGKLLPIEFLTINSNGCLNVHPSLLPLYRGASPIQSALLNGERTTGISIMKLDEGMDSGDILLQETGEIQPTDDSVTLSKRLAERSAVILTEVIPQYLSGEIKLQPQDASRATFCQKITSDIATIDWSNTAVQIHNLIRALAGSETPFCDYQGNKLFIKSVRPSIDLDHSRLPGSVSRVKDVTGVHVLVQCGEGELELLEVQLAGKRTMLASDFLNGQPKLLETILK